MMWKAFAQPAPWAFGADLSIGKVKEDSVHFVTDLTFEIVPNGAFHPSRSIPEDEAVPFMQAVMDAAYEYGLRPSQAQDEKHLKAHLKDMQEITRHVLKMK